VKHVKVRGMADTATVLFTTRGAAKAVSDRIGVSQAAVSQWRERGIPARRLAEVEAALAEHLKSIGAEAITQ
jgi:DNA-binding transcriptional regulator YdaS (Cro superfamily)